MKSKSKGTAKRNMFDFLALQSERNYERQYEQNSLTLKSKRKYEEDSLTLKVRENMNRSLSL